MANPDTPEGFSECMIALQGMRSNMFSELMKLANLDPGVDLCNADLTGIDLSDDLLIGYNFTKATLRRSKIKNSHFLNCTMDDTDVQSARFETPRFIGCLLSSLRFERSDLTWAFIFHSRFTNVEFRESTLANATLRDSHFKDCAFAGSNLRAAVFDHVMTIGFRCRVCDCTDAYFENAVLPGALFVDSTLRKATFRRADLRGAMFRGVDLRGANLKHANLTQTTFEVSKVEGTVFGFNQGLTSSDLEVLLNRGAVVSTSDDVVDHQVPDTQHLKSS